jgi:hypothetical protein
MRVIDWQVGSENKLISLKLMKIETEEPTVCEMSSNLRLPAASYSSSINSEIINTINLGSPDWKIILDESFRSLQSGGILKFMAREFLGSDLRDLLIFLGANSPERNCELISLEKIDSFHFAFVVKVKRKIDNNKTWSVCYITNGSSVEQINQSARNLFDHNEIEILVSGPKIISNKIESNIKFIEFTDLGRDGRISLKKNLMVSQAKGSNLLLLHDRYLVDKDFFESFDEFGYDYGVVAPKQIYAESQKEYPGMLTLHGSLQKKIESEVVDQKMWVGGGCIVVKKEIFEKIPLNSFLSWCEAEDIEWAQRLLQSGITPRIVKKSVLLTVSTPNASIESIGAFIPKFNEPDLFSDLNCLATKGDKLFFDQLVSVLATYNLMPGNQNKLSRIISKIKWSQSNEYGLINITANRYVFVFYLALLTKTRKSQSTLTVLKHLKISKTTIFHESKRKGYLVILYLLIKFLLA